MVRKVRSLSSPGKGGVKHDIKKPISKKKEKPNIVERLAKMGGSTPETPTRTSKRILAQIDNVVANERPKRPKEIWKVKPEIKEDDLEDEHEDAFDSPDPQFDGLCDYEKIRMQNILERQAMFNQLELSSAKMEVNEFTPTRQKYTPSSRGLASEKKEKIILPPRKSARIAGGLVPEIERFVPLVEEPVEEDIASLEVLGIKDSFNNADDEEFVTKTKELMIDLRIKTDAEQKPSFQNFNNNKSESELKIKITEDQVAKVVPDRIFSLKLHPGNKVVCAVGGKHGHVGLWDVMTRDSRFNDGVHVYHPHVRPVNTLSWDSFDPSRLVSTSYDGTSRILNCEAEQWEMLYGDKDYLEEGGWTSCHAQQGDNTFLISQGNTGTVVLMDRRVGWSSPASSLQCFQRLNPKSLSVHPLQPHLFLTGTNKGGCFVFDVRTGGGKSLIKPVTELLGHSKSLSTCVFSPVSGNQVASLASDDKIRLYDTSDLKTTITPQCTVHHNNQTGRWLTPLRLTWHPLRDGVLVSGSMARPRQIEVWRTGGGDLRLASQLTGEHLASVTSIVDIHPGLDLVVGGNSSGRCHVFM